MLRRNRPARTPAPTNPAPQRLDLAARNAHRRIDDRDARRYMIPAPVVPQHDPLAGYLEHFDMRVRLPVALPPVDLAAEHDARLAELLTDAQLAREHAAHVADDWQQHEPGRPRFADALATYDPEQIVAALTTDRARRFADAWCAQAAADDAEHAVRDYAAGARELLGRLDRATDALRDEMLELFTEARDRENRRAYDDALALIPRWRALAALYRWCQDPMQTYRPPAGDKIGPAELAEIEHDAAIALGEYRPEGPRQGSSHTP